MYSSLSFLRRDFWTFHGAEDLRVDLTPIPAQAAGGGGGEDLIRLKSSEFKNFASVLKTSFRDICRLSLRVVWFSKKSILSFIFKKSQNAKSHFFRSKVFEKVCFLTSVADPELFDTDPDPTFYIDTDPDNNV